MKVSAEFINTDQVDVTLTVTMPLGHWKQLEAQLPSAWPGWDLGNAIREAVGKLEGRVSVRPKEQR